MEFVSLKIRKILTFHVRFKYTLAELAQSFGISEAINNSPIRQQNQCRQSTMKSDPVCVFHLLIEMR